MGLNPRGMKDAELIKTWALPNGAATTNSAGIDLGNSARGDFVAPLEVLIEAPAAAVGNLANGETIIYHLYHDTASDFSGETLLLGTLITQTGAVGAGAAADSKRVALPTTVKRYLRCKSVKTGGTGNASPISGTVSLLF